MTYQIFIPEILMKDLTEYYKNDSISIAISKNKYGAFPIETKFEFDPELGIEVLSAKIKKDVKPFAYIGSDLQKIKDNLMRLYEKEIQRRGDWWRDQVQRFPIPKKTGGVRWIWNPLGEYRKRLEKYKYELQLARYLAQKASGAAVWDYAFVGGIRGIVQSWRTSALPPTDTIVIKYDLENHYERLKPWQVAVSYLRAEHFKMALDKPEKLVTRMIECAPAGRCRQGLPTSPYISALSLKLYDQILAKKAFRYYRYVDDILFLAYPFKDIKELVNYIFALTRWFGQRVNKNKLRIFRLNDKNPYIRFLGLRLYADGKVELENAVYYEEQYKKALDDNMIAKANGYKGWLDVVKR